MNKVPNTPAQSLETLKNRAFNLLYRYAQSTRDLVHHNWYSAERKQRVLQLASFVKKDLNEYQKRLNNLEVEFKKLPGKVLSHPHHPVMLALGGKYIGFVDDITTVIGTRVDEMVELLTYDIDEQTPKNETTQAAV